MTIREFITMTYVDVSKSKVHICNDGMLNPVVLNNEKDLLREYGEYYIVSPLMVPTVQVFDNEIVFYVRSKRA